MMMELYHKKDGETCPYTEIFTINIRGHPSSIADLYPLLPVDLHSIGSQGGDGSVYNLLHHLSVPIGFFQLGGCNPNMSVGGNIFTRFIQDLAGILIGLKPGEGQPQLGGEKGDMLRRQQNRHFISASSQFI